MTMLPMTIHTASGPIETVDGDTAITVGVFDGVHRGHQALLEQLEVECKKRKVVSMVVTLTSHPSFILGRRDNEYWLDDPQEHLQLLFEAGARYVVVLPFTREVAGMSACAMARLLYDQLNMRSLLIGYDSRFGSKQNDDFDRLPQLSTGLGFSLQKGEPFLIDGEPISSSRIRNTLTEGRVEETAMLLGRPFSVSGIVQHGRGIGHTIGFPTANLSLDGTRKMLPREGVYAVRINGNIGMANLGTAPTFGVEKPLLEVHLLDFHGDLYGQTVTVEFSRRLRDIERFDNAEALEAQLQKDIKACRKP